MLPATSRNRRSKCYSFFVAIASVWELLLRAKMVELSSLRDGLKGSLWPAGANMSFRGVWPGVINFVPWKHRPVSLRLHESESEATLFFSLLLRVCSSFLWILFNSISYDFHEFFMSTWFLIGACALAVRFCGFMMFRWELSLSCDGNKNGKSAIFGGVCFYVVKRVRVCS